MNPGPTCIILKTAVKKDSKYSIPFYEDKIDQALSAHTKRHEEKVAEAKNKKPRKKSRWRELLVPGAGLLGFTALAFLIAPRHASMLLVLALFAGVCLIFFSAMKRG